MKKFTFEQIENAYANQRISLKDFALILAENFGKKKARKILRRNLEKELIKQNIDKDLREVYLQLISALVEPTGSHIENKMIEMACGIK